MNLEEFFLSFQDYQNEIGALIDEDRNNKGDLNWLWHEADTLLSILEKIINVGKSGETR
jgi:hypothetical protein